MDGTTTEITAAEPIRRAVRYAAVVAELLTMEEAQRLVLERVQAPPAERVSLEEAAGRVLAVARTRRSTCRLLQARRWMGIRLCVRRICRETLSVVARIAAGRPAERELRAGEAMAVATGGVVPEGADAVIPLEYVVEHDNVIEIAGS